MKALIIVDIQNDFLPGGALAVNGGDTIIPLVNRIQDKFDIVVMTQDFHPADHGSFASNHHGKKPYESIDLNGLHQVLWPDHCIQGTIGSEFPTALHTEKVAAVFTKGTDSSVDSYSGFFDNGKRKDTGLGSYLRDKGVDTVYVCGLATDYCVKSTAIDASLLGFQTFLIEDASQGVELQKGDIQTALSEMKDAGVKTIQSDEILHKQIFTIQEIERAILQSPKHKIKVKTPTNIDGNLDVEIETIEVDMFWFRLFGSNKNEYDKFKNPKNLNKT